jgi:hypothetical protein
MTVFTAFGLDKTGQNDKSYKKSYGLKPYLYCLLTVISGEQEIPTMDKDEFDYYAESIASQLMLIIWVSLSTLVVVGMVLAIAS